jgi:hypothetical protein
MVESDFSGIDQSQMKRESPVKRAVGLWCLCATVGAIAAGSVEGQNLQLQPGKQIEISFADSGLPPTLYSMMNGTPVAPCLTLRLPDDYNPTNKFPLLLYVPGNDGGEKGNIYNAETIAGRKGWVAATVPLFKKTVDRNEVAGGVIVSFEDYPALSRAYRKMLGRLFELIPNIDSRKSAMVGFSNGSITIAVLVSNHDEFILDHFRNFCLVDHGMSHLVDLHKSRTRESKFLILVGDQEDFGRDVKIRQGQLQQDAWKLLGVDVSCRIMKGVGHEFNEPQMEIVRDWLRNEVAPAPKPKNSYEKAQ